MIVPSRQVPQKNRRAVILCDQQIHRAIIIEVSDRQAASREWLRKSCAALLADVLKSLARVAKQQHRLPELHAFDSLFDRIIRMAVTEQQVKIAVIVVIKKFQTPAAHQPRSHPDPIGIGNVAEHFVLIVVVERVHFLIDIGREQVDPAILIVVRCVYSHPRAGFAKAADAHACKNSDFLKSPLATVRQKKIRHRIVSHI